jgi:hypothetical protein
MKKQRHLTIRDLYPEMNDTQLAEAEQNLRGYVQVIWRIYKRLKAEGKSWPALEGSNLGKTDLTGRRTSSNILTERSNSPININPNATQP